jgi:3-dehydroquinate synthase
MTSIKVTAEREYLVHLDSRWRDAVAAIADTHNKTMIMVPTELKEQFQISGLAEANLLIIEIPEGESAKSPEFLLKMWEACGEFGLTRSDCIIGIGGGSATDLAGFVAASWLRGIAWHAIPTSLAGMVDAAIGGKTGINSSHGKNLIGAFHSPSSVIIDLDFLKTLSDRDFSAGMAEVIKAGFISDPKILDLASDARANIAELILRSIAVKAKVVSADFKESRLREILNYGHTLGHAIEKTEGYKLRHGEAVAIGLVFAAELSNIAVGLNSSVVNKHRELLQKFDLPISYKPGVLPELLELMAGDKKSRGTALRFIGLEEIGKPIWLEAVTSDQIVEAYGRISS